MTTMSTLRAWLQRDPAPSKVRCTLPGGEEKTVRIGDSRSRWRDAAASCAGAVKLEAFNDANETLRVWEDGDAAAESGGASKGKVDGQGDMLVQIARLLKEASDSAAERHENAYRLAYEQQSLLVNVLSVRLQSLERAWHRLIMSESGRTEEGAPDPNANPEQAAQMQMVQMLLAGALSPPTPPPNGKG